MCQNHHTYTALSMIACSVQVGSQPAIDCELLHKLQHSDSRSTFCLNTLRALLDNLLHHCSAKLTAPCNSQLQHTLVYCCAIPSISMASISSAFVNPFRQSFRYVQRQAHENPVITYSIALGVVGKLKTSTDQKQLQVTVQPI